MNVELFVDTQSLFYDVRKNYGTSSRLDFLRLKDNICKECDLDADDVSMATAFIVNKGNTFQAFFNMLSSFGYNVSMVNKGSQDMEFAMSVAGSIERADTIVLVTGNRKLNPVIDRLLQSGKKVYIVSFKEFFSENSTYESNENVTQVEITDEWMWSQG